MMNMGGFGGKMGNLLKSKLKNKKATSINFEVSFLYIVLSYSRHYVRLCKSIGVMIT